MTRVEDGAALRTINSGRARQLVNIVEVLKL